MSDDARHDEGMRVRREVLGDAHVDRAAAAATPFDAPFQRFITCVFDVPFLAWWPPAAASATSGDSEASEFWTAASAGGGAVPGESGDPAGRERCGGVMTEGRGAACCWRQTRGEVRRKQEARANRVSAERTATGESIFTAMHDNGYLKTHDGSRTSVP